MEEQPTDRILTRLREADARLEADMRRRPLAWLGWGVAAALALALVGGLALTGRLGFADRTLWDLLTLLGLPASLALAGYYFSSRQQRTALAVAEEQRRQETLERYFDRMKELLLDHELGPNARKDVQDLARAWTVHAIHELEAGRNRQLFNFLQGARLLGRHPAIDLRGANLQGVDLRGADMHRVDLFVEELPGKEVTNLREADLRGANLREADLRRVDLSGARLNGADLTEAKLQQAILNAADLRGSRLPRTELLAGADLTGALSDPDVDVAALTRPGI